MDLWKSRERPAVAQISRCETLKVQRNKTSWPRDPEIDRVLGLISHALNHYLHWAEPHPEQSHTPESLLLLPLIIIIVIVPLPLALYCDHVNS